MNQQSQILNYLHWSRERGLVWPPSSFNSNSSRFVKSEDKSACETHTIPKHRISLLTLRPDGIDEPKAAESRQLLDKMCAATRIPQSDFYKMALNCCRTAVTEAQFQALLAKYPSFILVLGEEAAAALDSLGISLNLGIAQNHNGTTLLFTHHPKELLTDPQKKISAWQHLQTMMHLLKN